jgi:hypothetical protein
MLYNEESKFDDVCMWNMFKIELQKLNKCWLYT